jgi:hypothetical protein
MEVIQEQFWERSCRANGQTICRCTQFNTFCADCQSIAYLFRVHRLSDTLQGAAAGLPIPHLPRYTNQVTTGNKWRYIADPTSSTITQKTPIADRSTCGSARSAPLQSVIPQFSRGMICTIFHHLLYFYSPSFTFIHPPHKR